MLFSKKGRVITGLLVFAALSFIAATPSWAEPAKPILRPLITPKGAKQAEGKSNSSADLVMMLPSDTKLITLFGVGYQTPVAKNTELRIEAAYGTKSANVTTLAGPVKATVTSIPLFVGARYAFSKSKNFLIFGEGGVEYNMVALNYKSQSTSATGLTLGGGGDYFLGNNFFATGSLRFHTATVSNTTPSITLAVGVGMKF
jgi:opacity protein-like surface antigen